MAWVRRHRLVLVLLAVAAVYFVYFYMQHTERPGAVTDLGWAGWADQGRYLDEARAIREGDLTPGRYQYPMGYPMVGVPFVHLLPDDPFVPVNLVCLLAVVALFFLTAKRFVGSGLAFLGGLLLVLATPLVDHTAVPWTTTPAVVTVAWWAYVAFARQRIDLLAVVVGGGLLGWTYMARGGGEWLLLAPFGAAVAWQHRKDRRILLHLGVLAAILAAVAVLNALWTRAVFGTWSHPYLGAVAEFGFDLGRAPSSLWGTVVYSGPAGDYWPPLGVQALWLAFAPFGMYLAARGKDRVLHLGMVASTVLGFVVVASFGNYAASALKYHCLHYLKLWLPILAVYSLVAIRSLLEQQPNQAGAVPAATVTS
ncbi:MAG: hypothetical protein M3394_08330 [Actinomycetota bacterium]|nr:hypothetical protein [Actinomycetota bacterium]